MRRTLAGKLNWRWKTSAGLDDLARLDAAGADVDALGRALHEGAYALDVRVPPTLGTAVRVRHRHTPRGTLAAYFTNRCHDVLLHVLLKGTSRAGRWALPTRPMEAISGFAHPPRRYDEA